MKALERVIQTFSPQTALKRARANAALDVINSGYSNYGANTRKKSMVGWTYGGGSAEEDIEENLDTLRQRSRDLYMGGANIATGALKTMRTNCVGTGLRLKSVLDEEILGISEEEARALEAQIMREFSSWADNVNCDLERIDNFYELQQLAFLNALMSGDVVALLPTTKRKGCLYDLRVQLIESDRVSTPDGEIYNPLIVGGVEKNKTGEVVAYHISEHHPLAKQYKQRKWIRIEAFGKESGRRNVLHIMQRERIGQVRGVPYLAPVIESLKQLGRYTEAELVAAVVSGLFTVFIEKVTNDGDIPIGQNISDEESVDEEDETSIELAPGAVIDLGENEKANMVNPGRPNGNFDPFTMSIIKQIGAALEIPYEIVMKCFTNSYSASRGALLEFWKTVTMQRNWLATDFCQPIFEEWLTEAVAKGRIKAPGFFSDPIIRMAYCSAEWNGPSAGQLDPLKEVEAAEKRVEGGYSTRSRETTELTGGDYYKNIRQRKREEKALKEVKKIAGSGDKGTMGGDSKKQFGGDGSGTNRDSEEAEETENG